MDHSRVIDRWPRMRTTMAEALKLPEYSCTVPTGVAVGKTWRRENGAFDEAYLKAGGKTFWLIGRYEEASAQVAPDGKVRQMCKIVYYRPVIRVKCGQEIVL